MISAKSRAHLTQEKETNLKKLTQQNIIKFEFSQISVFQFARAPLT